MSLPKSLKKRRVKLGRSLRKAAEISGLSNPHLCQMEGREDVALLKFSWLTLRKVCKAYDISPKMLDEQLQEIAVREKLL